MKIKLFIITIILLLLPAGATFAHALETDGNISVTLHTGINDRAIAGELTTLHFSVNDRTGNFHTANCDCKITITKGPRQLVTADLKPVTSSSTIYDLKTEFNFPEKGSYKITVAGTPKTKNSFQNFSVTFDDYQVGEAADSSFSIQQYLIILGCLVVSGAAIYFNRSKN